MLLFLATNMAAVTSLVAISQQEYVHDHFQYLSEMVGKSLGLYNCEFRACGVLVKICLPRFAAPLVQTGLSFLPWK